MKSLAQVYMYIGSGPLSLAIIIHTGMYNSYLIYHNSCEDGWRGYTHI